MDTQERVTLGKACAQLGVTRKTLAKWIKREKVELEQHPRDWRFYTIAVEDVEAIRAARAEMPGASGGSVLAKRVALETALGASKVSDIPPMPSDGLVGALQGHARPTRVKAAVSDLGALATLPHLPDGLIGDQEFARRHGIPYITLHDAVTKPGHRKHVPPAQGGPFHDPDSGQSVAYALDATGQALAYRYYVKGHPDRERTCCPHEVFSSRELAPTVPIARAKFGSDS